MYMYMYMYIFLGLAGRPCSHTKEKSPWGRRGRRGAFPYVVIWPDMIVLLCDCIICGAGDNHAQHNPRVGTILEIRVCTITLLSRAGSLVRHGV